MTRSASAVGRRVSPARLERKSAGGSVADHVRKLIFDGELRGGDRVPQQEIAETLGVSRIPVREGIVALEREGFVTIEPHRGAFVNRFDRETIEDHYELFGVISGHVARRMAERASPEDLAELEDVCQAVELADDSSAMRLHADHFWMVLARVGGSRRLNGLMQTFASIVPGSFFDIVPDSIPVARRGFREIAAAIRRGDGDAAAAACIQMMRAHVDNVVRVHEERKAAIR
jgi:DNA-binding GntR family transcriptional regulator